MEEKERRYIEEDEITLKELILKIKEFFWEVVRNWKWVVLIVIPFVTFFMYKAVSTPVTYEAELTFMVNEDDGGGMGGVSAILDLEEEEEERIIWIKFWNWQNLDI